MSSPFSSLPITYKNLILATTAIVIVDVNGDGREDNEGVEGKEEGGGSKIRVVRLEREEGARIRVRV